MTRKKVKLAYITNDSARKATFKKRKKGLMKKVSELSTLCGIDACAIIYSPYEPQPDVWPNGPGVHRVLSQFKRMPEMEQSKKMVNQEGFIRQRIMKANEQLKKQHRDNREKEMTEVMYQCLSGSDMQNLGLGDLHDLGWIIDQNLKEIYKRIEDIKKTTNYSSPPLAQAPGPMAPTKASDLDLSRMMGFDQGVGHVEDQKPANDYMGMDPIQSRPLWFTEWMSNPNDQSMRFGSAAAEEHAAEEQMMLPFGDTHNPIMWSNSLFH
ncbi:agamous-like MADS-box protein AGL80 [Impatiens glandulifera]|uniref:agamous-like MADS-box protein AGL80 n=1 Tax=Impatiens glandulifera TaxID=253017 RepID=UPI001FB163A5|nr:agamous-like MADS-box protein AGL80 [Impatiens glandulifera]